MRQQFEAIMLSNGERKFLTHHRIAHLATADKHAVPHVVPVCFAILDRTLYITIDEKPKRRPGIALKRLKNIAENPAVAVVVDRYDEDWARLGWIMLRGQAEILTRRDGAPGCAGAPALPLSAARAPCRSKAIRSSQSASNGRPAGAICRWLPESASRLGRIGCALIFGFAHVLMETVPFSGTAQAHGNWMHASGLATA